MLLNKRIDCTLSLSRPRPQNSLKPLIKKPCWIRKSPKYRFSKPSRGHKKMPEKRLIKNFFFEKEKNFIILPFRIRNLEVVTSPADLRQKDNTVLESLVSLLRAKKKKNNIWQRVLASNSFG